jgi:hypothetical protein
MVQRGRKSPHLSLVTPTIPGQGRLEPKDLPAAEAKVWRSIVSAMPEHWFRASEPLLRCLCTMIATSDVLAAKIAKARTAGDWNMVNKLTRIHERTGRCAADLSAKLRLTPRSMTSVERAANLRQVPAPPTRPWEIAHNKPRSEGAD